MTPQAVKKVVESLSDKIAAITDEHIKSVIDVLLNLLELQAEEIERLTKENQEQKDEIKRLKGEKGKPNIRKQSAEDHSSEKDRKPRNKRNKKKTAKKPKLTIHKTVACGVESSELPPDAVLKSYEDVIIQDIILSVENTKFRRAVYYSPSLKKTFSGQLPGGYAGDYGPGVRALILSLYHDGRMTQSAITRFLTTAGIQIAKSTVARLLIEGHDAFHQEKSAIVAAGLTATDYQHIDDTGGRVHGKNHYVNILSNPYYTAYFTLPKKDRYSILSLLCQGELRFDLTPDACTLMAELNLPQPRIDILRQQTPRTDMTDNEMDVLLKRLFPNPKKHHSYRRMIREACAITAYRKRDDAIRFLIADDAPQFKKITQALGLCWVHEGRHYKKLNPMTKRYRTILDNFITKFWGFYHDLLAYKQQPTTPSKTLLSTQFDTLFTPNTAYTALNTSIMRTANKKQSLLLVLQHPHLPLHNNDAELGARVQARIRDIHLHTMSQLGTQAKDTFATLVQTARKLGVNLYDYFYDRITLNYQMNSLAETIPKLSNNPIIESG